MIAYVNGSYLLRSEAAISIEDRAIMVGESVFDILRTYNGQPLKLTEHLERLRRSLRYVEFDADPIIAEVEEATHGVLQQNAAAIRDEGDVLVRQIVTRGRIASPTDTRTPYPTIIVMAEGIDFADYAAFYERGVDLQVSLLTLPFGGPLDPRLKAGNRLANMRAHLKAGRMSSQGGGHWTVVFNADGSIAETNTANLFIVAEGQIVQPPRHEILGGISLKTTCDLAKSMGIEVVERKITLYDLINADETFITSTSFSILPVASIDGIRLMRKAVVGPRLLAAWIEHVHLDFVAQAVNRTKSMAPATA